MEVQVSSGLPLGQGLWVQQTWVWHKPSWRRAPLTHHRATRTYTALSKQTLGGHKQNPVCTRTQEKGAVTAQETDPDLPVSVQDSPVEVWIGGGLISSSILGTYKPGDFIFQCPVFLPFHTVHGVLKARILKWFAIPFSSGSHFFRTLYMTCPSWMALHCMTHSFMS